MPLKRRRISGDRFSPSDDAEENMGCRAKPIGEALRQGGDSQLGTRTAGSSRSQKSSGCPGSGRMYSSLCGDSGAAGRVDQSLVPMPGCLNRLKAGTLAALDDLDAPGSEQRIKQRDIKRGPLDVGRGRGRSFNRFISLPGDQATLVETLDSNSRG